MTAFAEHLLQNANLQIRDSAPYPRQMRAEWRGEWLNLLEILIYNFPWLNNSKTYCL